GRSKGADPGRRAERADGARAREGRPTPRGLGPRRPARLPRRRRPADPEQGAAPSLHPAPRYRGRDVAGRRSGSLRPHQRRDGRELGTDPRWLEVAVPAHVEAVEAVSEILSRVGPNGIAAELPLDSQGGADHTVKAYLVEAAEALAKVSAVRDAAGHLQAFGLGPIGELAVRQIEDGDWLE